MRGDSCQDAAVDNRFLAIFFDVAYALVIFAAFGAAGSLPGWLLGFSTSRGGWLGLLPGIALALAGWIWIGWLGERSAISRFGLVLFAGVGAAGFVVGWSAGLRGGARARARCSRTPASPR